MIFAMIALSMLASCGSKQAKVPAIDLSNLDTSVAPGDDFYKYSIGGWQEKNPLGPQYARFGSFDQLRENNVERINALFAKMSSMTPEQGSDDQKIVDLYKQGLDSVRLNEEGAAPVLKYIEEVYAVDSKDALVKEVAKLHDMGIRAFFGAYVTADLVNSDTQVLGLSQGGLGLNNRDYYLDPANAALKEGYRAYIEKIFTLAGVEDPAGRAANVLAVEDALAQDSWSRVQQRNVHARYNPMSSAEIEQKYSGFDFKSYFAARGIDEQEKVIVGEPSFFAAFSKFYPKAELAVLKDYVAGQVISNAADAMSDAFYDAYFDFFSRQMSGVQEQKPRWKRAMAVPDGILGEAVGKMYVELYFPESSKLRMKDLVENLRTAFSEHIDSLDWMSDETKAKAHEKLAGFTVKIGYPDEWKDYSSLTIDPNLSYLDNQIAASAWRVADNLSKIGKPTDKTEWHMTPQTVNAYYNPTSNEICFPAAILQPPFFNPDADDPVNYGGIGVVIGHEMSHGFDDQGAQFDKDGNMVNWWTEEDAAKFKEKGEALAAQFDAVEVLPGLMADGHMSLGENIGDHGGLSISYTAMHNAIKDQDLGLIDGFTPDQRFYLSYGAIWAQNITDEEKARLTKQDSHSLAENRVNVSVRNFQTFFDAFGIKEGDPMYRPEEERVHIW